MYIDNLTKQVTFQRILTLCVFRGVPQITVACVLPTEGTVGMAVVVGGGGIVTSTLSSLKYVKSSAVKNTLLPSGFLIDTSVTMYTPGCRLRSSWTAMREDGSRGTSRDWQDSVTSPPTTSQIITAQFVTVVPGVKIQLTATAPTRAEVSTDWTS